MTQARLIRRTRFRATHHYALSDRSDDENRRVFGDQTVPHEHDWMVEVHIVGPMDPSTGFVADLGAIDDALESVTDGWDGGDLNVLIPEVAAGDMQPSTESLARWIYGRLEGAVPAPAVLTRVAVFESADLGAEYPA